MFIIKRYKICEQSKQLKENNNISEPKLLDRKESPRKLMIALFALCIATYNTSEATFLQFDSTYYQNSPLGLTASKAAEFISSKATSYTIGRGISVFIAIKVKPQYMIAYHLMISIMGIIVLIFAQNSTTFLWIANVMIGFGFSAMFPAIFAFIRQYIEMTDRIGTILTFSGGFFNLFSPFILGAFIEKFSVIFIIFELTYLLICSLLFCVILYVINNSLKYKKNSNNRVFVLN